MSSTPLVSVILPSYNHQQFVTAAVESVLKQTLTSLEIIVVDDGSSDQTADQVRQMNDPRLRCIALKENRRFHARNYALQSARGQYVAFQNSDDTWAPNKLAAQVAILEQQPELSVCFTAVQIINERDQPVSDTWANNVFQTDNRSSDAWLRYFFDFGNAFCISSACTRRNLLEQVGYFNPSLIQLSDLDLWVRLAAQGEFSILPEPLTRMRVVPGRNVSAPSATASKRHNMELLDVLHRFTQPPILNRLPNIFSDVIHHNAKTHLNQLVGLAQHAWTLRAPHVLFGNTLMASLLSQPQQREDILHFYGTQILHEFIKKKGEVDITI